jgi:DNA-binding transcriptional LysR family regulator
MDLNDIRVFAQVVQRGSFIGASRALEMPRSTVSRRISELEQRLGARLLQRTTRKLSLTDVGQTYYEYAARIMAEVDEANLAVSRLQASPRGKLRVTAPVSFGHLAPVIASYLVSYPDVEVDVVCIDRGVDLLQEGFDVAIRAGRLADSTLFARSLGTMRNILVASPSFLRRQPVLTTPGELEDVECVLFGAGSEPGAWAIRGEGKTVRVRVRGRLIVNDFEYVQQAAIAGLGVAMLPAHRCVDDIRSGKLRRVLPEWYSPEVPVHAVYASARHLSPKVKTLLDHLRDHLRTAADPSD